MLKGQGGGQRLYQVSRQGQRQDGFKCVAKVGAFGEPKKSDKFYKFRAGSSSYGTRLGHEANENLWSQVIFSRVFNALR